MPKQPQSKRMIAALFLFYLSAIVEPSRALAAGLLA
jgi:hypothetical protein